MKTVPFRTLFLFCVIALAVHVLFSLLYSPVGTLLQFCFPACSLVSFVLVDIIFWFSLFAGSIYCTLFLLDCSDFAYRCICVQSVTLFIVVINLCLYTGLLQFCEVFIFSPFFFFPFLFFITFIFNFFKNLLCLFCIYSFVCSSYCSFPLAQ